MLLLTEVGFFLNLVPLPSFLDTLFFRGEWSSAQQLMVVSFVLFQALNCVGRILENHSKLAPKGSDNKASKSVVQTDLVWLVLLSHQNLSSYCQAEQEGFRLALGGEICRICTCCKKATLKKRLSWFCFSFLLSRDWRTKPKKILHLICHKTCVSWCLEAANVKTLGGVAWNVII